VRFNYFQRQEDLDACTAGQGFFPLSILWCSHSDINHPQEESAKFGSRSERTKQTFFRIMQCFSDLQERSV
jgi:hypothetical protein